MVLLYLGIYYEFAGHLALGAWYILQGYVLLFSAYVLVPVVVYALRAAVIKRFFQPSTAASEAQTDFVLLVPAHNEEELLPGLLASIGRLHYPASRFRTVVVADNCTDHTARLARQAGAECLERTTVGPSDKTQALRYASKMLVGAGLPQATVVCVLDADCSLDPPFLAELDRHFAQAGAAPVVQCSRRVANAFDSDVTVLDAAAEALRQQLGSGVRHLLGLEAFIFGLGCCMRAAILVRLLAVPSPSLAEDKEWKAYLTRHRIPVAYCPAASLSYFTVNDGPAFQKQRRRWLAGQAVSGNAHGLALLTQGLRRGGLSQLDFACSLLQPPRSLLLLAALVFGVVAGGSGHWVLLACWLVVAASLLGYGVLGLHLIGALPRHLRALLYGGRLVAGVAKSWVLIGLGVKEKEWQATR
jgi:cellulose synthase/poly-beta-1,6-N-acetylglucosamine synthase-like glycosyltransferase